MAIRPNAAWYVNNATLLIAADDFTAGVSSVALTPKSSTTTHVDIGGGVQSFVSPTEWTLDLEFSQDFTNDDSLSFYLIENAGLVKTAKLTPVTGGRGVTVEVTIQPAQVGGKAAAVATTRVGLPVTGEPDWDEPEA